MTESERRDVRNYEEGITAQFERNGGKYRTGQRIEVRGENQEELAKGGKSLRLFRSEKLLLAKGDRIRVTHGGKTADGRHRLENGATYSVAGFTKKGDIVLGNKWIVSQSFGHIAPAHVVTSYAAQGRSEHTVFVSMNAATAPAIRKDVFYVAASRGKKSMQLYTDCKEELRESIAREDNRVSAIQLQRKKKARVQQFWKRVFPQIQKYSQLGREGMEHGRERAV